MIYDEPETCKICGEMDGEDYRTAIKTGRRLHVNRVSWDFDYAYGAPKKTRVVDGLCQRCAKRKKREAAK